MTWAKLDDRFHTHGKVLALFDGPCPGDAIALWTLGASWAANQLSDGAVSLAFVRRAGLRAEAADELVRVGLWERDGEAYRFHNWLDFNPSREHVLREREAARIRKQAWRDAKRAPIEPAESVTPGQSVSHPVTTAVSRLPRPDPTRPDQAAAAACPAVTEPIGSNPAKAAWQRADEKAGGLGQVPSSHDEQLAALSDRARELCGEKGDVDATLDSWAAAFMRTARKRHVAAWLSWCTRLDAAGDLKTIERKHPHASRYVELKAELNAARCAGDFEAQTRISAELDALAAGAQERDPVLRAACEAMQRQRDGAAAVALAAVPAPPELAEVLRRMRDGNDAR